MVKKYSFCSGTNFNITILSYDFFNQYVYLDKDNYPAGPYANLLYEDVLFTKSDRVKEGCKFTYTRESSHYNKENGTYSGPIDIIGRSKADIFVKPEEYYPIEKFKFVDYSDVIGSFSYKPAMIVEDTINENTNLNGLFEFLIPSINFFLITIFSILIYFIFMFFILRLKNFKSKNLIIIFLSFLFTVFLFLIDNLYNSSLSAEDVIVDTSEIIDNFYDILNTKREICFIEKGSEMDYFKYAKKDSLIYKIYEKRDKISTCYYFDDSNLGSFTKKDLSKIFILMPDKGIEQIARIVETAIRKNVFIGQRISILNSLRTFIINKRMNKEKKDHINKFISNHLENGFLDKLLRDVPNLTDLKYAKRGGPDGLMTFFSLQDYIEHNTKITALSFDKLEKMFLIYFSILITILIIYLINLISVFIQNLLIIVKKLFIFRNLLSKNNSVSTQI